MQDHATSSTSEDAFRLLPSYGVYLRMRHGGALGFDLGETDKVELMKATFSSLQPNKRQKRAFARLCSSLARNSR
jgi:hypothetical protein